MDQRLRERALHYLVAIAAPTIVVAIHFVAGGLFGDDIQFMSFVAAVMLAAFYGGWKPGVVATLLSAAAGDYFLIEPRNSFYIELVSDQARLALFLVVGGLISWLLQSLQNSRRSLETERTKARRGEQQIRSVVDNVIDAIITIDATGKIESFNPAAAGSSATRCPRSLAKTSGR